MKVAIVITGLSTGGAETMLLKLLENIDRGRFAFHVISLTTLGEIGPRISSLGIPVEAMGMARGSLDLLAFFRLMRRLRELRVSIVHTWMYHADLLGGWPPEQPALEQSSGESGTLISTVTRPARRPGVWFGSTLSYRSGFRQAS